MFDNLAISRGAEDEYALNYVASPTIARFHESSAYVRGIMGPYGSGKSVACCIEIMRGFLSQPKSIDGKRRSRWLVVRNTVPELETTTLKTWRDWFPESKFGPISGKVPITHRISVGDVEAEIVFLALNRPEDVRKLVSLECTGIWFNEARFIERDIVGDSVSRTGRYPPLKLKPPETSREEWTSRGRIIMDTNPPDTSHWWYAMAEENKWATDREGELIDPKDVPEDQRWAFFKQPSALSPEAENLANLPPGYYERQMRGRTKEWVNVYVHGKYGYIQAGRPVYGGSWNDDTHCPEGLLKFIPAATLYVGLDFGLTPCAVFGQKTSLGQWQILDEIVTTDMGIPRFAQLVKSHLDTYFPGVDFLCSGDPAGSARGHDERTAFEIMRSKGVLVRPAPGGNRFQPRRNAVLQPLERMVDGKPGLQLSRKCEILRRGFNGGYRFKRLYVSGDARYSDEPDKNQYSHPHDALQYLLCGGGEYHDSLGWAKRKGKVAGKYETDWSVF